MSSDMAEYKNPVREYVAFISYRRKEFDIAVSQKLHSLIEQFHIPKPLRKNGSSKLGIAFRDIEELSASEDLTAAIYDALDHSQYLIVVCTPDTPQSKWVEKEINYFLQKHDRSHILVVLAAGTPEESFPHSLVGSDNSDTLPAAAYICAESTSQSIKMLRKESLRLFAAILGCAYDELVQRKQKQTRKRISVVILAAFLILLGYVGVLIRSNRQIEEKNNELSLMNDTLVEQKKELQLSESFLLTENAETALAQNNLIHALEYSVAALPHDDNERPYYPAAEKALMSAMGVFDEKNALISNYDINIELISPANTILSAEDGKSIIVLDDDNNISSYNIHTGTLIWRESLNTYNDSITYDKTVMSLDEPNRLIYTLYGGQLFAFDLDTGTLMWETTDNHRCVRYIKNSNDNSIMVFEENYPDSNTVTIHSYEIIILDALSGNEIKRYPIDKKFYFGGPVCSSTTNVNAINDFFFDKEGTYFYGVIYDCHQDGAYDGEELTSIEELGSAIRSVFGVQYAIYYYIDFDKDEIHFIYSEKNDYNNILWMGAYEENNQPVLTVIKECRIDSLLKIEKINLNTKKVIYEVDEKISGCQGDYVYSALRWKENRVLVSVSNQLFVIEISTGKILDRITMQDKILSVFDAGNGFAGFVTADGTYEIGWLSGTGFSTSRFFGATFFVGESLMACPGERGFIKGSSTDRVQISVGNYTNGHIGYIATIDASNTRRLIIHYLIVYTDCYDDVQLTVANAQYLYSNDGDLIHLCKDGKIYFCDSTTLYYCDPECNIMLGTYDISKLDFSGPFWLVPDENTIVASNPEGLICYDVASGKQTSLVNKIEEKTNNVELIDGQEIYDKNTLIKTKSVQNPEDDSVLTALCNGKEIEIWRNRKLEEKINLPEELIWCFHDLYYSYSLFDVGKNGYTLLSSYNSHTKTNEIKNFVVYDIKNEKWMWMEDLEHGSSDRKTIIGDSKSVFAVYDYDMKIRIYNPVSGTVDEIKTNVSPKTVASWQFFDDDNYILICTRDGMFKIYDTNTSECVYSDKLSERHIDKPFSAHMDSQKHRVYIIENGNHLCVCLDALSWTELGRTGGVYGFDDKNDRMYLYDYTKGLYYRRIPSLKELVDIGRSMIQ